MDKQPYNLKYRPEFVEQVEKLAAEGFSFKQPLTCACGVFQGAVFDIMLGIPYSGDSLNLEKNRA